MLEIVEMLRDQDLEHVVTGHLGVELQEQALAQIACADAGRIEPLNELQALARLVRSVALPLKSRITLCKSC